MRLVGFGLADCRFERAKLVIHHLPYHVIRRHFIMRISVVKKKTKTIGG
jgi:hypothetical protein